MAKRRSGGVDVRHDANVRGDLVGRDKYDVSVSDGIERVKKFGLFYLFEVVSVFVFSLAVAGIIFGIFGGIIGMVIGSVLNDGATDQMGIIAGAGIGVILAVFVAFSNAGSISRYKAR